MAVNSVTVEGFAALFHHYYSALAPDFGCSEPRSVEWERLPANERQRFMAATRLALQESERCEGAQVVQNSPETTGTEGRECGC